MGITPQQFADMQKRLGTRSSKTGRSQADLSPAAASSDRELKSDHSPPPTILLGIDPSLRGTGYGVIQAQRQHRQILAQGTIRCPPGWDRSRCLARIFQELRDIIQRCHPTVCVIESLYYAQNLQTALIMGEARGAALVAVAEAGLEIYELAPRKVKQAIVGYGAAQKLAVAKMVQRLLQLPEMPAPDAADALALALVHAQESNRFRLTSRKKI